jgi:hypothetical protein
MRNVSQREVPLDSDKKSLTTLVNEAKAMSPTDHILNVFKATLATAPFTGGIASLLNDYIPSQKQKRLEDFAEKVAADLERLQDRVDESNLLTEEFAYTFEKCFKGAVEHYQKDKMDAFRGILVNSAIGVKVNNDEKDYFINLASTMSTLHIRIMKFTAFPNQYLKENDIPPEQIRGDFSQFFPIAIPNVDLGAIISAFGDLYNYGFLSTKKDIFHTMTYGKGLELLGNGSRVTDFGKRFIQFCTSP